MTEEEKKAAIEADALAIALKEKAEAAALTEDGLEAKNIALEAEKARLIEERENYKIAYLKEKSKKESSGETMGDDERLRHIAREELATSKISEVNKQQEEVNQKIRKENKELKIALLNKKDIPAAAGSSTESVTVKDTLITPEQMSAFKARNWNDKDIERYKKNIQRYGGR